MESMCSSATPLLPCTELLSSGTPQCPHCATASSAALATLQSLQPRPQTPRPHNQRPVGQPREGAQHIPAGLPSSKQLLTVLTPNLLFSGPFVNLHKANNTVCPAKLSSIAHI